MADQRLGQAGDGEPAAAVVVGHRGPAGLPRPEEAESGPERRGRDEATRGSRAAEQDVGAEHDGVDRVGGTHQDGRGQERREDGARRPAGLPLGAQDEGERRGEHERAPGVAPQGARGGAQDRAREGRDRGGGQRPRGRQQQAGQSVEGYHEPRRDERGQHRLHPLVGAHVVEAVLPDRRHPQRVEGRHEGDRQEGRARTVAVMEGAVGGSLELVGVPLDPPPWTLHVDEDSGKPFGIEGRRGKEPAQIRLVVPVQALAEEQGVVGVGVLPNRRPQEHEERHDEERPDDRPVPQASPSPAPMLTLRLPRHKRRGPSAARRPAGGRSRARHSGRLRFRRRRPPHELAPAHPSSRDERT